jgi:hypothetical protein
MSHRGPSTVSSISNASQQHATALQRETNRQLVRSRMRFCTFSPARYDSSDHASLARPCHVSKSRSCPQVEATRVDRIVEIVERFAGVFAVSDSACCATMQCRHIFIGKSLTCRPFNVNSLVLTHLPLVKCSRLQCCQCLDGLSQVRQCALFSTPDTLPRNALCLCEGR